MSRRVWLSLLLVPLAAPVSAGPSLPDQAACAAAYKTEYESDWGVKRDAWTSGCKTKDAAALLANFKDSFIKACVERSSPTIPAKLFTPEDILKLCSLGLPGEAQIKQRVVEAAALGPRGPPDGAENISGAPAIKKTSERVEAVTAGLGAKVAGGDVAGIYGEATRNAERVEVLGGQGAPGGVGQNAPTAGINGVKGLKIREPGGGDGGGDPSVRISRLPYDSKVKGLLTTMVQNADPEDTQTVLSTLEKYKPSIQFHQDGIDGAYGQAWTEGEGKNAKSFIELSSGFVQDKDGKTWPLTAKAYREELQKRHMELSRSPPTAITKPNSPRTDLGIIDGYRVYEYADGSQMREYSAVGLTGTLMHETHHVKRRREGGAANSYTDERDAHDIAYRFYTRFQQNQGGNITLDDGKLGKLGKWQRSPGLFNEGMIEDYIQNGEITAGQVSIADQEAAYKKLKAETEKKIADRGVAGKAGVFVSGLFGGKDEEGEALTALNGELAKLEKDKLLAAQAEARNKKWRADREASFKTSLDIGVEASRKQILADKKLSKKERAKRLADLEGFRQEGLKDPWTYIPFTKDPS